MATGFQENAFGRRGVRIRIETHPRQRDLATHVLFRHEEVRHRDARTVLHHQVDRGVFGAHAALPRHFSQRLARERLERRILETQQQRAGRAGRAIEVLPGGRRIAHLGQHARANRRVFEPRDPRFQAAVLHPRRHGGIKTGGARRIHIHVGRDADSGGARRLHLVDQRIQLAPVALAGGFQVIDFRWRSGGFGDIDGLLHRLDQPVPFTAHVYAVDAAAAGGFGRERHQLGCLRVSIGAVDERGGDPERPLLHGLTHQRAHLRQLRRARLHVALAEHVGAHRAGPDEGRDIRCDAALLEPVQILPERRPVDGVANVRLPLGGETFHFRGQRPHRVFPQHLERDTLAQVTERTPVREQRLLRMRQHVDEAGRHCLAVRIDPFARGPGRVRSDVREAIAFDRHITDEGGASRAVIDGPAADENIVVRRLAAGSRRLREGRACEQGQPLDRALDPHERRSLVYSRPYQGARVADARDSQVRS